MYVSESGSLDCVMWKVRLRLWTYKWLTLGEKVTGLDANFPAGTACVHILSCGK